MTVALAGAVESLLAGDTDRAARLLRQAVTDGALRAVGDTRVPPPDRLPDDLPDELEHWRKLGFIPLVLKPAPAAPRAAVRLATIFRVLPTLPVAAPPHWICGDLVVTLYLPGAADLRPVPGGTDTADARRVHAACLRSLAQFVEAETRLREAVRSAGVPEPEPFPIRQRFDRMVTTLGSLGARELATAVAGLRRPADRSGREVLFADPKPANLIVPAAERRSFGVAAPWPVRIDLDMMYLCSPLSLQLVLIYLSFPIGFEVDAASDVAFADVLGRLHAAAREMDAPEKELPAMVVYHLLRNAVTAAAGAHRDKARAMASLAVLALRELPEVGAPRHTANLLSAWADGL